MMDWTNSGQWLKEVCRGEQLKVLNLDDFGKY